LKKKKGRGMWRTNKKVWEQHKDLISLGLGVTGSIPRSVSWTPETLIKTEYLAKKYNISRSAVIRILVNELTLDALDKKLQNEENIETVLQSST